MDKIKLLIKDREQDTFAIHYACECFYNGGAIAPAICANFLVNLKTKEVHTFALHNYIIQGKSLIESEYQLLIDFVDFYKSLNSPIFINWAMDGIKYGFKAIYSRAENFGIYDFDLSKMQDINLSNLIDYSLMKSLEMNNCKRISVLSGKDEAMCFDKRDFNLVQLSTQGKALGILDLFEKYISNDLEDDIDFYE